MSDEKDLLERISRLEAALAKAEEAGAEKQHWLVAKLGDKWFEILGIIGLVLFYSFTMWNSVNTLTNNQEGLQKALDQLHKDLASNTSITSKLVDRWENFEKYSLVPDLKAVIERLTKTVEKQAEEIEILKKQSK